MIGDIDLSLQPKGFELTLYTKYKVPIAILSEAFNCVLTAKFNDISELSFKIPYYIFDENFQMIENKHWNMIDGELLISLNDEQFFEILYPTNSGGDGKDFKEVKCYSYEYILNSKKVRGLKDTLMLYDSSENKAGWLNKLESETSWRVNFVDPIALVDTDGQHPRYRTFDISEKTWLEFLNDLKLAFDCIFFYDTINKQINIYATQNVGKDSGLYISNSNVMSSFQKQEKYDEIVSQLNIYGSEGRSITTLNPLGTTYIEDFSYYLNTNKFRPSLRDAVINYNNVVNSHKGEFNTYLSQLTTLNSTMTTKENELNQLKLELIQIQDQQYVAINQGQQLIQQLDLTTLKNQETAKQTEINNKQIEIDGVQSQIDTINNNIETLQQTISKENNFTTEQLAELDDYIHQNTWTNDNITDESILYEKGLEAFSKVNQPTIEYSVNVVDFLKVIEYQYFWDKLSLGDFITINYKYGEDITLRLVSYTHDYNNNKLTLELSNKDIKNDAVRYLGDVFASNVQTSTAVNMSKYIWDKSEINSQTINDIVNNNLDATRNAVEAGISQDVIVDRHGITLKNLDNPNEQLRLLSNVLAFTSDGWNSANLAITSSGIVGQNIYGKVIGSEKLIVTNETSSFLVDKDRMTATDMILSLTTTTGNGKIYIDPTVGIKIQNNSSGSWVDSLYMDTEGNLTMDGRLKITDNGITLFDIYKNANGGSFQLYDINSNLNVKISSENGTGGNIGGTAILYNDSSASRVELGISTTYDAGIINLKDSTGTTKIAIYANGNLGTGVFVNGQKLTTESWVNSAISSAIADHVAEYHSSPTP